MSEPLTQTFAKCCQLASAAPIGKPVHAHEGREGGS